MPPTPTTLAVDLGSCTVAVWAAQRGTVSASSGDTFLSPGNVVRRGRVIDVNGCIALLSGLVRRFAEPLVPGGVVVACRPVLASEAEQALTREVLDAALAPRRVLFVDTVRAAAIGSGAAAGSLLVVDVGAELTEIALLQDGHVVDARRAELGTQDLGRGATMDLLSDNVVRQVDALSAGADASAGSAARRRGVLLVGDGALRPGLAIAVAGALRVPVHRAHTPRTAALHGAGLAAMSLLRHPARTEPAPSGRL